MINTNNPSFQEFIFSDERFHKLKRHFLFWMVVGAAYFYQSLIPVSNPFRSAVVSLFCFFPTCVLLAYGFMRFLWTALSRKAYFSAIFWFSFLSAVAFGINYFTSFRYFQLTCNCDPTTIQPTQCVGLAIGNTFNAITIGVLVLGIKFTKELLLRQ